MAKLSFYPRALPLDTAHQFILPSLRSAKPKRLLANILFTVLFLAVQCNALAAEPVIVVIDTSAGDITLELYPDAAPLSVTNFLHYVDTRRFNDHASFYRTVRMDNQEQNDVKIEVIQGGLGMESDDLSFAPIAHETTQSTGILHKNGTISMARLEPGSAASEFFICINDQPGLDFGGQRNPDGQGFAAFGKVIDGMDVVREIQNMRTVQPEGQKLEYTSGQMLVEPVVIHKISRRQDQ